MSSINPNGVYLKHSDWACFDEIIFLTKNKITDTECGRLSPEMKQILVSHKYKINKCRADALGGKTLGECVDVSWNKDTKHFTNANRVNRE